MTTKELRLWRLGLIVGALLGAAIGADATIIVWVLS